MSKAAASGGIGVFGLLTVAFVILKIIGVEPIKVWPWLSANPFEWSVLMFFLTWPIFLILCGLVIWVIALIVSAIFKG